MSIEQRDTRIEGRQLIVRPNRLGIGIDVGWAVGMLNIWWGNTKDADTLARLAEDAVLRGIEFGLSDEARAVLEGRQ